MSVESSGVDKRLLDSFYNTVSSVDEQTVSPLDGCLHELEKDDFASIEGNSIQKLAVIVRGGVVGEKKELAAKVANVVVSSKLFPLLPKADRKAFLSVAGWEGARTWPWWKEIRQRIVNAFHFGLFSSEKTQQALEDKAMEAFKQSRFSTTRTGEFSKTVEYSAIITVTLFQRDFLASVVGKEPEAPPPQKGWKFYQEAIVEELERKS